METNVLVLHGLVVKKAGTAEQIAAILGADEAQVRAELEAAVASGDVAGAKGTFMPTPVGRARLDAAYPEAYAAVRKDEAFTGAADRFEVVNRKLLALLTRWQSVPQAGTTVPNDHSDPAYDNAILDELGDLHERAEPILDAFADAVPRMKAYAGRLAAAYDRALAGETDFVSGVRVDSYHTVWHELHEDLLRILGRTRQE
ncbi:hypothetical protein [Pseudonocardia acidicola]|uniref:MarR family transcriptional regulator n=1 Tax=Pseudonocardia acidicola TaxID=2724939 RepID=A0ABX1SEC1_9PSEU|nr:hypothetical protein [Pseudonocardia acidicola]NMH98614.1 hypothetical protein [Pseudonocardia acidicola]